MAQWVKPVEGRTPIVIVSVAHLDDEERALVLGVLLEARRLRGSVAVVATSLPRQCLTRRIVICAKCWEVVGTSVPFA